MTEKRLSKYFNILKHGDIIIGRVFKISPSKQASYSWGELYETIKQCEGNHEDMLFSQAFDLFEKLDNEQFTENIRNLVHEQKFTKIEINRINSPCFDGILHTIYSQKPMLKLIRKFPQYLDTCKYYLSRGFFWENNFLCACHHNRDKIVKIFLNNQEIEEQLLYEALDIACERGYTKIVEILIDDKKLNVDGIDDETTPLLKACVNNRFDTAKFLLDRGANIETCNFSYVCGLKNSSKLVELLLNRGAIADEMAMYEACRSYDCTDTIHLLLNRGVKIPQSLRGIFNKNTVELLLNLGVVPQIGDLTQYAYNRCIDIVTLLLEKSTVPIISDEDLHAACSVPNDSNGSEKMPFLLLKYGAIISQEAFAMACINEHYNFTRYALNIGFQPILDDSRPHGYNYIKILDILIEKNICIPTNAITLAVLYNNIKAVKTLLKYGADIHIMHDYSIHIAKSLEFTELANFLMENGANLENARHFWGCEFSTNRMVEELD